MSRITLLAAAAVFLVACGDDAEPGEAIAPEANVTAAQAPTDAATPSAFPSGNVPSSLSDKMAQVESEKVDYPGRSRDIERMKDYIANGDFEMGEFKADSILEAQHNLKLAEKGLPAALAEKMERATAERVDYPDRARDVERMYAYIAEGDLEMAEHKADGILEAQANLKSAEGGLPPGLQALIDRVDTEKVDYPDRSRDVERMKSYLAEGDFEMAEHKAEGILEAQANLKAAEGGLPADLQALIDRVDAEKVDYPDRSRDVQRMNDYIAEGDFDMGEHKAEGILEAQTNLRAGVPADLQAKMDRVESEKVDYPDRSRDVRRMNDYLANGDFDMVEHKADGILEAQNNLRK